ncbi:MCE family protein [Oxalobacteraceae bacterium OM1]|nr:MCE family protein [Oxalobacteraceae bacterium OM1]
MESRSHALSAGLFLLLLCIALAVVSIRLTGGSTATTGFVVESLLPVTGLQPNAPVRLRGVDVGRVAAVRITPDPTHTVLIDIRVDETLPLHRGAYAQLGLLGVTGLSFVQLHEDDAMPGGSEPLAGGARIPMRPSFLDAVGEAGEQLMKDSGRVIGRLDRLLSDQNLAHIGTTLANLDQTSQELALLTREARPAIRNIAALSKEAGVAMRQVPPALASVKSLADGMQQRLGAVTQLGDAAQELGATGNAIGGSLPGLMNTVSDLSRSLRMLDRALDGFEQHPQALIFGPPYAAPGPGEQGYKAALPQSGPANANAAALPATDSEQLGGGR